jgi:hypothetical protein
MQRCSYPADTGNSLLKNTRPLKKNGHDLHLFVIIINRLSTRLVGRSGFLSEKKGFQPAFLGKTLALTAKLTIMSAHCYKRVD